MKVLPVVVLYIYFKKKKCCRLLAELLWSRPTGEVDEAHADGTRGVIAAMALRFGKDQRLKEIRRLLRSDTVVPVRLPVDHVVEDHDRAAAYQRRLLVTLARQHAGAVGRGMLNPSHSIAPLLTVTLFFSSSNNKPDWNCLYMLFSFDQAC
jgi:hypothetical protein